MVSRARQIEEWSPIRDLRTAYKGGRLSQTMIHTFILACVGLLPWVVPARAVASKFALPDGRSWELVSPPNKHGAGIEAAGGVGSVIQAAANGSALTYVALGSISSDPAGNRALEYSQVFTHRTSGGWISEDIATPHEEVGDLQAGSLAEYKFFSEDLSVGLVEPKGETPLPPLEKGAEKTIYLRNDSNGSYLPLVTSANVRAGAKFGEEETNNVLGFVAATPDLDHIVLESPEALTSKYPSSLRGGESNLYEWSSGVLQQVNVLPNGKTTVEEESTHLVKLGANSKIVRNAVSADGTHVVWSATEEVVSSPGIHVHLYMRDMAAEKTVQLDVPEAGVNGSESEPEFQDASSNDSRVFFTDRVPLTSDAGAGDLYVFEAASGNPLGGKLIDLTPHTGLGENAAVQGIIPGASEDGSYVYFVANGALAPEANPGNCEMNLAPALTCNLYVEHNNGTTWETPKFIATLSNEDELDWGAAGVLDLTYLTSRVSPNGEYLAFMSDRSLTGYDNRDVISGEPDEEVYLYDARTGRLACASCNPTGSRPSGVFDPRFSEEPSGPSAMLIDLAGVWSGHWLAASLPGWTSTDDTHALRQPRYLSNSGHLFFDSSDALVPDDVNNVEDVYEYEPEGPWCSSVSQATSEVFKPARGTEPAGCVALISSGTSSRESAFLDASGLGPGGEEGEDVFFLTAAQLTRQDVDSAFDVYDAHKCSAASPCLTLVAGGAAACEEVSSCRGPSAPQPESFGPPASVTFAGATNSVATPVPTTTTPRAATRRQLLRKALKACGHRSKRRRGACERRARLRYGPRSRASRAGIGVNRAMGG